MRGKIRSRPRNASSRRRPAIRPLRGGTWRRSTSRSRIRTSGSRSTSRKTSNTRARSSTTRNSSRSSRFRSPRRSPGCARGRSPTPRPSRACSGQKKCWAENGARVLSDAPSRASEPVAELQPVLARVVFRLLPGKTHPVHHGGDALKVRVVDVPVVGPQADRPVIFLEHERGAVAATSFLLVGGVHDAEAGVAQLGRLPASREYFGFERRREDPTVAEVKALGKPDRRIDVTGLAPVTDRARAAVA